MGPGDPFASPSAAPAATRGPAADPGGSPPGGSPPGALPGGSPLPPDGPVRIQALMPDPTRPPVSSSSRPVAIGAVLGLVLSVLGFTLGAGKTAVVLLCVALGAALGGMVRSAFAEGIDPGAAWRALRRK